MKTTLAPLTTLDHEVQQNIITLLTKGNYLKTACIAAGITYSGFRHWQKRWEDGDPAATERFGEFFSKIETAVRIGEAAALDRLMSGGPNWQAQAWFLERRFAPRWGKQDRSPVPPRPKKPIADMTPDELDEYERSLDAGKDRVRA
jgi:hypothetical protein